jgi:MFS family permease
MSEFRYSPSKIVGTLLAAQSLFSAAMIMTFTVASIQVVDLAGGRAAWTGVPSTVGLVAAALMSYPIGWLMDAAGRRPGLALGFVLGVVGSAVAVWALIAGSLAGFLVGVAVLGLQRGSIELGRYAAADASPPEGRGRAISLVVLGGTVGSVAGPSLIALAASVTARLGLTPDSGPWLLGGVLSAVGLLLIVALLRPDPRDIARHLAANGPQPSADLPPARTLGAAFRDPRVKLAVGAMVFSQLAMVIVMTVTPIHMRGHQHAIGAISLVIMAHTLGMFGFSFVAGWLADKIGRSKVILAGGLITVAACVIAPFSTAVPWLAAALFLLGLGWSLCFVAGSALLDDALQPHEKGRLQGSVDAMVKVSSGAGSLGSGVMFAAAGYAWTSWVTLLAAVVPVILVAALSVARPATPVGETVGETAAD